MSFSLRFRHKDLEAMFVVSLELRELMTDTRVGWPCFAVGAHEMTPKSTALWRRPGRLLKEPEKVSVSLCYAFVNIRSLCV